MKLSNNKRTTRLSFLVIGYAISKDNKYKTNVKNISLISGFLCIVGFLGTVLINENLWYLAPLGYGVGTMMICIEMIKHNSLSQKKGQGKTVKVVK